jgi:RNA polymerase sigma-70 factor (ECF subfamily)
MDAREERELTEGLAAGNPDAWRALYDAYAQSVWRLVARLMGPGAADVADVVQDAFLAAARSAGTYDPKRGTLWNWLCGIARRQSALHYRKQERQDRVQAARKRLATSGGNGEVARWLEDRQVPPAEVLASVELATLVRAALTELSDDHGSILTARYLEDIPVEQIARTEQCSTTAVHSRLARAKRAFREKFARLSDSSSDDNLRGPR